MLPEDRELLTDLKRACNQAGLFALEYMAEDLSIAAEEAYAERLIDIAERLLAHAKSRKGLVLDGEPTQLLAKVVFEKVWIMDDEVVGSELTPTFHELLTVDAHAALDEERTARAVDEVQLVPRQRSYHRRLAAVNDDLSGEDDLNELAARLWIERPHGRLPVDSRLTSTNPGPRQGNQGLNVLHLVGVAGFEPTASSSRSRYVSPGDQRVAANALVTVSGCVGARRRRRRLHPRSSPRFLPAESGRAESTGLLHPSPLRESWL